MASEREKRAKDFLASVLTERTLEALPDRPAFMPGGGAAEGVEGAPLDRLGAAAQTAVRKLKTGQELAPDEQFAVEAIIIPDRRPAIDIRNGDYTVAHPLWQSLNAEPARSTLRRAFPSIGRIELPNHPTLPYGGTGFVVGKGLLMTNRHVAEIFTSGFGTKQLVFRPGLTAGIDFVRERDSPPDGRVVAIREVVLIHPFWDMALLRVEGLDETHPPLTLSLLQPEALAGEDVAVVGYPAFDPRNDAAVQDKVFGGVYNVKRLQPGKLNGRDSVDSFGKSVAAATHDSSTLGGNSGSAVVHIKTGHVVGLHFAGVYLKANYAVPTAELARDGRLDFAGLNFSGMTHPDSGVWSDWWRTADGAEQAAPPRPAPVQPSTAAPAPAAAFPRPPSSQAARATATTSGDGSVTITVPLEITVRLRDPSSVCASATVSLGKDAPSTPPSGRTEATGVEGGTAAVPQDRMQAALDDGYQTFRDHFASLYQSAVADVAGRIAADAQTGQESIGQDGASAIVRAGQVVARARTGGVAAARPGEPSDLEKMSVPDHAAKCTSLAWDLLQARVLGDTTSAAQINSDLTAGSCDARWAGTINEYVRYFGVSGTRQLPQYVTPAAAGSAAIPIKAGARIALIGDWGTGAPPALRVLEQVREQKPDVIVHLGDIYYSGIDAECRSKFEDVVDRTFDRGNTKLPVYTLAGNHDMYCGGVGYYALIARLNAGLPGQMAQRASFFSLRAEDASWQLLAMDTGRNDYSPFSVTDVVTFVDAEEQAWLRDRVAEFPGKTILLSHHQLFSAFSQIGPRGPDGLFQAVNPKLQQLCGNLRATGRAIPAWFWGHEHNLCIYQQYGDLPLGRCLGHSAIPVFIEDTPYEPLEGLRNPPVIAERTRLSTAGGFYTHGFAMLSLSGATAIADYYEDINGRSARVYTETLS